MRKKLERELFERWPKWFDLDADPILHVMARGFEHGDGWFDIVWQLCEKLEPLVAEVEEQTGERFEVLRVKEKFGTLRFDVNHLTSAITKCIEEAEAEALRTCEMCGQRGKRREGREIKILCSGCAKRGSRKVSHKLTRDEVYECCAGVRESGQAASAR